MVANVMLALHCKKTDTVDLKGPIWEYISNTYSVDQVRHFHSACQMLCEQRHVGTWTIFRCC